LLILGAGHVGQAVARFAQLLDFRVIVSDDRKELCNADVLPGNLEFLAMPMAEIPAHLVIDTEGLVLRHAGCMMFVYADGRIDGSVVVGV